MSVKRIFIAYENQYGKLHEITDYWLDEYVSISSLNDDVTESLTEFLETKGVFNDTDADD